MYMTACVITPRACARGNVIGFVCVLSAHGSCAHATWHNMSVKVVDQQAARILTIDMLRV